MSGVLFIFYFQGAELVTGQLCFVAVQVSVPFVQAAEASVPFVRAVQSGCGS